jgi:hypothetical protein
MLLWGSVIVGLMLSMRGIWRAKQIFTRRKSGIGTSD